MEIMFRTQFDSIKAANSFGLFTRNDEKVQEAKETYTENKQSEDKEKLVEEEKDVRNPQIKEIHVEVNQTIIDSI